ncbi:MAG: copper chaperone PCu(A)C [Gammaproteobacteria bacterium]|nr:copper chaperone PCu(A)C [Gammaproteobacteria bacterium]
MQKTWISASPPGVNSHAAYLEIHNQTGNAVSLLRVTSPRVARIEVHLSEVRDGVAGMRRQDAVAIPAGATVEFAPRGYHLMLFDAAPPLRIGESVPFSFEFSDGSVLNVQAVVERRDDPHAAHPQ